MGDWFDDGGTGSQVDAVAMLDSHAGEALHAIVGAGALVSMGLTSDGGALGVTVTVDGRYRREYFRDSEQLELWAAEALPAVMTARGAEPVSGGPRQRARRSRGL